MARRNLGLIAAALALVVLILLGSRVVANNQDDKAAGATQAATSESATPSTSVPPSETAPGPTPPAGDVGDGEIPYPPPAPAELSSPAGQVAYAFVLAYNTFSPTSSDSGQIWVRSWADYATDEVRTQGEAAALRLWSFTWQTNVSVIYPVVSAVSVVSVGDNASIWELSVTRTLFPIGGTTTDVGVPETVRWSITVTGTATDAPLVSGCVLLTLIPQPETA